MKTLTINKLFLSFLILLMSSCAKQVEGPVQTQLKFKIVDEYGAPKSNYSFWYANEDFTINKPINTDQTGTAMISFVVPQADYNKSEISHIMLFNYGKNLGDFVRHGKVQYNNPDSVRYIMDLTTQQISRIDSIVSDRKSDDDNKLDVIFKEKIAQSTNLYTITLQTKEISSDKNKKIIADKEAFYSELEKANSLIKKNDYDRALEILSKLKGLDYVTAREEQLLERKIFQTNESKQEYLFYQKLSEASQLTINKKYQEALKIYNNLLKSDSLSESNRGLVRNRIINLNSLIEKEAEETTEKAEIEAHNKKWANMEKDAIKLAAMSNYANIQLSTGSYIKEGSIYAKQSYGPKYHVYFTIVMPGVYKEELSIPIDVSKQ